MASTSSILQTKTLNTNSLRRFFILSFSLSYNTMGFYLKAKPGPYDSPLPNGQKDAATPFAPRTVHKPVLDDKSRPLNFEILDINNDTNETVIKLTWFNGDNIYKMNDDGTAAGPNGTVVTDDQTMLADVLANNPTSRIKYDEPNSKPLIFKSREGIKMFKDGRRGPNVWETNPSVKKDDIRYALQEVLDKGFKAQQDSISPFAVSFSIGGLYTEPHNYRHTLEWKVNNVANNLCIRQRGESDEDFAARYQQNWEEIKQKLQDNSLVEDFVNEIFANDDSESMTKWEFISRYDAINEDNWMLKRILKIFPKGFRKRVNGNAYEVNGYNVWRDMYEATTPMKSPNCSYEAMFPSRDIEVWNALNLRLNNVDQDELTNKNFFHLRRGFRVVNIELVEVDQAVRSYSVEIQQFTRGLNMWESKQSDKCSKLEEERKADQSPSWQRQHWQMLSMPSGWVNASTGMPPISEPPTVDGDVVDSIIKNFTSNLRVSESGTQNPVKESDNPESASEREETYDFNVAFNSLSDQTLDQMRQRLSGQSGRGDSPPKRVVNLPVFPSFGVAQTAPPFDPEETKDILEAVDPISSSINNSHNLNHSPLSKKTGTVTEQFELEFQSVPQDESEVSTYKEAQVAEGYQTPRNKSTTRDLDSPVPKSGSRGLVHTQSQSQSSTPLPNSRFTSSGLLRETRADGPGSPVQVRNSTPLSKSPESSKSKSV